MTKVTSINQFQNQLAFRMLENAEFDTKKAAKVSDVTLNLDGGDDVVMLRGDNLDINVNEGNNTVYTSGNNNNIKTGNGDNDIVVYGNKTTVSTGTGDDTIYVEGDENTITSSGGNNTVSIIGDTNALTSSDGDNKVAVLGNYNNVELGNGNQYIAYWGNNNNINVGDGNSKAMTMDFALRDGKFRELEDIWVKSLDYYNSSEKVNSNVVYDYSSCNNAIYAALSDEDKEFAETVDLTEMKDGKAKYVVGANAEGYATLYVYSYTYNGVSYYYPRGAEGDQSQKAVIMDVTQTEVSYYAADDYDMIYSKNYVADGVSGNNIKFGNGDNTIKHTVADGSNTVDMGTAETGHTVEQQLAYSFAEQSDHHFTNYFIETKKFWTVTPT